MNKARSSMLGFGCLALLLVTFHTETQAHFRRRVQYSGPTYFVQRGTPTYQIPPTYQRPQQHVQHHAPSNLGIQDIQGFQPLFGTLLKRNGNIFITDRFQIPQKILIDRNTGQLFFSAYGNGSYQAANDPELLNRAIGDLKEFYLKNLEQFKGGVPDIVQRFLRANGVDLSILAPVQIDFARTVTPPDLPKGMSADQFKLGAFSYLLNSLSFNPVPLAVNPASLNNFESGHWLKNFQKAILFNDNPYACTGKFRVDALINRAFKDPIIYYNLLNLNQDFTKLASDLGVSIDPTRTPSIPLSVHRIVVSGVDRSQANGKNRESIVGVHPERMLERQPLRIKNHYSYYGGYQRHAYNLNLGQQAPGYFYRSFDFDTSKGGREYNRSYFRDGIQAATAHDASEIIFSLPNGFPAYYLANKDNKRADLAFASIARDDIYKVHDGGNTDVVSPWKCMGCHSGGQLLGGGKSKATNKPYTDHYPSLASLPGSAGFFTNNSTYLGTALTDMNYTQSRMAAAGALLLDGNNPIPIVPKIIGKYKEPLTVSQLAFEMGVTEAQLQPYLSLFIPFNDNGKITISRENVEKKFCEVFNIINGRVAVVPGQNAFPHAGSVYNPQFNHGGGAFNQTRPFAPGGGN